MTGVEEMKSAGVSQRGQNDADCGCSSDVLIVSEDEDAEEDGVLSGAVAEVEVVCKVLS